jgi:hypothetical protein
MMISEVSYGKFTAREGIVIRVKTQCHDVKSRQFHSSPPLSRLHCPFNLPKLESRKERTEE